MLRQLMSRFGWRCNNVTTELGLTPPTSQNRRSFVTDLTQRFNPAFFNPAFFFQYVTGRREMVRPRGFEPLTFCSGGNWRVGISSVFSRLASRRNCVPE